MRDFAARLVTFEARLERPGGAKRPPAYYVCEKLRPIFGNVMGTQGFRALLARALALSSGEVRWLCALHVQADATLSHLDEDAAQLDSKELAEGSLALVAKLLGLTVTFIGEPLTLWMLREGWPELPLNDSVF